MHPNFDTAKGALGLGALIAAQLPTLGEWIQMLQLVSLVLGIAIAALTLRSMIKPKRGK